MCGHNAKSRRKALMSSLVMTSSCSVNRATATTGISLLPLTIKPKVAKEALQWRFEMRAHVLKLRQSSPSDKQIELAMQLVYFLERNFRSKNI